MVWAMLDTVIIRGFGCLFQMWKQVSRERKMAEMVGTNLQFKPVGGRAAWRDHNASVVDENIEHGKVATTSAAAR